MVAQRLSLDLWWLQIIFNFSVLLTPLTSVNFDLFLLLIHLYQECTSCPLHLTWFSPPSHIGLSSSWRLGSHWEETPLSFGFLCPFLFLFCFLFFEMGSSCIAQAGFEHIFWLSLPGSWHHKRVPQSLASFGFHALSAVFHILSHSLLSVSF